VNGPINTSVDLPPVGQPEVQSSKKIGFFLQSDQEERES